ncbi:hypothetical protein [Vibrio cyclitrophicus]|uniref:hypothetical protein n=1 Tax=Vibrio cyclitrophicus TaxID=47951 RepID=UPI000C863B7B|nr:hypothetical protein [Vibrio cyclitrophicus]PMH73232.1 hypothetical protein BCU59_05495 [Vibrio cyclitrophicus]
MKRIFFEQRRKDVLRSLKHRQQRKKNKKTYNGSPSLKISVEEYKQVNEYIDSQCKKGLSLLHQDNRKNAVIIYLPEVMDFENNYDITMIHINAISVLVSLINRNGGRILPRGAYNLASVNFDRLKSISTEAALALTAEISNWEDSVRNKLRPIIKKWDEAVYSQLHDLGFFDLFANKPDKKPKVNSKASDKKLVRYQKGICNPKGTTKTLKENIHNIVGSQIDTWSFLHFGLDEAITNVMHHAYPEDCEVRPKEKSWYLTASYSKTTKELKVAFFDQGVGIPNTLKTSKIKEKVDYYLSKFFSQDKRRLDETMLQAAIEVGRSSTEEPDRGNGLPDLLEFIRQTQSGELNIYSALGHYKFAIQDGQEIKDTSRLSLAMPGTLIVWRVTL